MRMMKEAIDARLNNRKRYSRQDFDKWLGKYDVRRPTPLSRHWPASAAAN